MTKRSRYFKQRAYTITELLIVIGIIALLATLLFAVFAQVRKKSSETTCLSSMRQLGVALSLYSHDYDTTLPVSSLATQEHGAAAINSGWAGRLRPYVHNNSLFRCPEEDTKPVEPWGKAKTGVPVSYAINNNLGNAANGASQTAPAKTVLLYEVSGSHADLSHADESRGVVPQVSASGYGLFCYMDWSASDLSENDPGPNYATGAMDNQQWAAAEGFSTRIGEPRHNSKSNFLALDGHVQSLPGTSISCGFVAKQAALPQTSEGCVDPDQGPVPCAEGTQAGKHVLTFSPQ